MARGVGKTRFQQSATTHSGTGEKETLNNKCCGNKSISFASRQASVFSALLRWGKPYCLGPPVAPPAALRWPPLELGCIGCWAVGLCLQVLIVAGYKCPEVLGGAGLRHHLREARVGLLEEGHRLLAG